MLRLAKAREGQWSRPQATRQSYLVLWQRMLENLPRYLILLWSPSCSFLRALCSSLCALPPPPFHFLCVRWFFPSLCALPLSLCACPLFLFRCACPLFLFRCAYTILPLVFRSVISVFSAKRRLFDGYFWNFDGHFLKICKSKSKTVLQIDQDRYELGHISS